MSKKKTLDEVIVEVLEKAGEPLRVEDLYQRIIEDGLYDFKSENPVHIVRTALRRKSVNLNFKSSKNKRIYIFLPDGTYYLKKYEAKVIKGGNSKKLGKQELRKKELLEAYESYTKAFKENVLEQLKKLDPSDFEIFCANFLKAYGFRKIAVTKRSRDGGIDGYGELKIGLSWMPVAFECKRYTDGKVGRPKIDQFRGALQGDYPYGIFFTTSAFTREAKVIKSKMGATPVVLIDGAALVDLMVEKEFGIEKEEVFVLKNSLDLAIVNGDG